MPAEIDFLLGDTLDPYPAAEVLVLGLGNCLIEDEGVGVAAIEYLMHHYDFPDEVELLDGGTSGMGLLDDLRNREHVIVLDAVRTGHKPGELVVLKDAQVPAFFRSKVSPHQLALSDVLAVLTLTNEQPGKISVIGVEPVSLKTRVGLSSLVSRQLKPMVEEVILQLSDAGYIVTEKPETSQKQDYYPKQVGM
ncbi:MAG: HyaD/HybD family hydrogenase maturation endopeptidase [Gammaproteobacteria bacterium]|nr:HyaD/HybD family hydrogenase maturation endopeptidase [Gammaproteobacteria bacterium]